MVAADLAAADASDMAAGVAPPVATSVEVDVATATLTSETVDVGRDTATTRADIDEVAEAIVAVEAVIEVTGKASEALNETSAPLRTLVPTPAVIAPIIADLSSAADEALSTLSGKAYSTFDTCSLGSSFGTVLLRHIDLVSYSFICNKLHLLWMFL